MTDVRAIDRWRRCRRSRPSAALAARPQQPRPPAPQPQQPSEIIADASPASRGAAALAVPDFIALLDRRRDRRRRRRRSAQVLWDDLNFEREFDLIPRDTYTSIPAARRRSPTCRSIAGASSAPTAWSSARVQKTGAPAFRVEVRLFNVRAAAVGVRARSTAGSTANPRLYAHTIADEIHQQQRGAARRRAHEADVLVRSRRRARGRTRSRTATSRRSTSPTTTARTSGASRSTAR